MLKDLLEGKNCFKLVCGAGNEDAEEVEKLVTIYSKAGCQFFDVCARGHIVDAAKNGLEKSGITEDRYICVSVGIDGDPHITKAVIDNDKCVSCGACRETCPHDAINEYIKVKKVRCLGCGQCMTKCPKKAITMQSELIDYSEVLPELISKGIDCIEFHAISENETEVFEKWNLINKLFNGMLCISVDRSGLGDKKLIEQVKQMVSIRQSYTTIIQADGVAMSGNNDEFGTTLQAVATAQMFENAKIPAYIMMSGGTNPKSIELAKLCNVQPHCLAVGSYARKIVKEYLTQDIYNNPELMEKAVNIAKNFVQNSLELMKNA